MSGFEKFVLRVGDVPIALLANDRRFCERVEKLCSKFICVEPPEFEIQLTMDDVSMPLDDQRTMYQLHMARPEPRGWLSWSDKHLHARVHRELFDFESPNRPRLLNVALCAAFNTVWDRQRKKPRPGCLLHSSAVLVDAGALVFTGPSGAGKTTIATLAGDRPVLNDETVWLERKSGTWHAEGTPFIGAIGERFAGGAPMAGLFCLEQGPAQQREPLALTDSFGRVFSQLLETAPLFASDEEKRRAIRRRVDLSADLVEALAPEVLRFAPDESVWTVLERP